MGRLALLELRCKAGAVEQGPFHNCFGVRPIGLRAGRKVESGPQGCGSGCIRQN